LSVDITNNGTGVNDVWLKDSGAPPTSRTEYKLVTALCRGSQNHKSWVTDEGEQPFDQFVEEAINVWGGELIGGISVQLMSQAAPVRAVLSQAMIRQAP
jgi:hypothetical protein